MTYISMSLTVNKMIWPIEKIFTKKAKYYRVLS